MTLGATLVVSIFAASCRRSGNLTLAEKARLRQRTRCIGPDGASECHDVYACARGGGDLPPRARRARYAYVHSWDCHKVLKAHYASTMRLWATSARHDGIDYVLLLPAPHLCRPHPLSDVNRTLIRALGVRVVETRWVVPPGLSAGVPIESGGCCGAREFMKLNALGLEADYDAVLILDLDTFPAPRGSLVPLLECAARGHVLTVRAWDTSVLGAFIAAPPRTRVLRSMLDELAAATVTRECGWQQRGWAPLSSRFEMRVQGFLYYFFYQKARPEQVQRETGLLPRPVDPCVWSMGHKFAELCLPELCAGVGHIQSYHKLLPNPVPHATFWRTCGPRVAGVAAPARERNDVVRWDPALLRHFCGAAVRSQPETRHDKGDAHRAQGPPSAALATSLWAWPCPVLSRGGSAALLAHVGGVPGD